MLGSGILLIQLHIGPVPLLVTKHTQPHAVRVGQIPVPRPPYKANRLQAIGSLPYNKNQYQ